MNPLLRVVVSYTTQLTRKLLGKGSSPYKPILPCDHLTEGNSSNKTLIGKSLFEGSRHIQSPGNRSLMGSSHIDHPTQTGDPSADGGSRHIENLTVLNKQ